MTELKLTNTICQKARLARDPRFDGLFFTGVKTTGIYCRPICPATSPKESNVVYFGSAIEAANTGLRPCLRCHPDSAPGSPAWMGTETSFRRAMLLIEQGALQQHSTEHLAQRLGISDRYLRQLFQSYLGISPKAYALYQQCLFAKQLLHNTSLSITEIALASGFNSIRRFNDCFKKNFALSPSNIRRQQTKSQQPGCRLTLYYRPPFDWPHMQRFLSHRIIPSLEWVTETGYGRTFRYSASGKDDIQGQFEISPIAGKHALQLTLKINQPKHTMIIVNKIKQLFDLHINSVEIDKQLAQVLTPSLIKPGIRIPGVWSLFEAGVRAILGQQVSVKAAHNLVTQVVDHLGDGFSNNKKLFPTPDAIAGSDLSFLKMPGRRKTSLIEFAKWYITHSNEIDTDSSVLNDITQIKGIGPWTLNYLKLRGVKDPDIWLGDDLGVKNALRDHQLAIDPDNAAPWRSYLTFQIWDFLSRQTDTR